MASEKKIERVLDLLTRAAPARVESLKAGARRHAKSIRRIVGTKNVVAVGISEKVTDRRPTGKLALTFYVERKVPLKRLRADAVIPATVPEALGGADAIPTDVVVLGKLRPEVNKTRTPLQPGNSVGHVDVTAGTLGAVVTRGRALHVLSNSHVLAASGAAEIGDPIIYPGAADGGRMPDDLAARLSGFKRFVTGGSFVNRADCAIARPTAARLRDLVSEIRGLGVPKGTIKPARGMRVVKVGRTTGRTTGEVRDTHFRFVLSYDGVGEVGFVDQVLCTRYTQGGDSGSLVLDRATGRAVGLHFAGASGGSVFNPIDDVLAALGVKLVTRPLGGPQSAKRAAKKKAAKRKAAKKPARKSAGTPARKAARKSAKKGAGGGEPGARKSAGKSAVKKRAAKGK